MAILGSALNNGNKIILDLCGGTGSWSKPYREAGYDVRVITLPEYNVCDVLCCEVLGNKCILLRNAKTLEFTPINCNLIYGILAAPPCTEFSVLNCIAAPRERKPDEGMIVVNACLKIIEYCNPQFWALENPVGYLRKYLGKPKMSFQPWEFGDAWTKRTDIWGNYNIPEKRFKNWEDVPKLPLYIRPNRGKPNFAYLHKSAWKNIPQLSFHEPKTDAEFTPPGFAQAFFNANM
jgi:site-specific DNA-cytosine methylase